MRCFVEVLISELAFFGRFWVVRDVLAWKLVHDLDKSLICVYELARRLQLGQPGIYA